MLKRKKKAKLWGLFKRKLIKALDDMKVDRQSYHGSIFVGNHCQIILEKYSHLCKILVDYPQEKAKFEEIFDIFANRFLTPEEVSTVVQMCE